MRIPPHWWINGPSKPRVASELFRFTRIAGGYAATYRRLFRIGPWSFAVICYRPGDDPTVPTVRTAEEPAVVRRGRHEEPPVDDWVLRTGSRCEGRVVAYADGRTGRCFRKPGHDGDCA